MVDIYHEVEAMLIYIFIPVPYFYMDDFSSSGTIGSGAGNTAPDGFDAKSMLMCIRILTL